MNYEAMPLVRIEVENMKAAIIRHLGVAGSDMGIALDEHIQKALDDYPWEQEVSSIVRDAIDSELQQFFRYGKGREAIYEGISQSFSSLFKAGSK